MRKLIVELGGTLLFGLLVYVSLRFLFSHPHAVSLLASSTAAGAWFGRWMVGK
jgi:hypothetical protein